MIADAGPDLLDRSARSLRRDLAEIEDVTASAASDSAPPGANGTSLELTHTLSRDEIERIVQSLVPS